MAATDTTSVYCEKCERMGVTVLMGVSWDGVEYRFCCSEPDCLHVRERKVRA